MKNKFIKSIGIIVLSIFIFNTVAFAEETSSDYEKKSQDASQRLEDISGEINTALQEVEDLTTSIDETEEEVNTLSEQIKELNGSIQTKQKELNEKQTLLEERLVASYMNGKNTYLDALFSGGLANFVSNYEAIRQIAEYDNNLIKEVQNTKKELEDEKSKVEKAKTDKENKSNELKKMKEDKEAKINNLTEEQKQIQSQMDEYDKQMKLLSKKEREAALAGVQEGDGNVTGTFMWPVPSSHNISSKYGYRIHPLSKVNKLHEGLDIAAPGGSDIVAADGGTVLLASYGNTGYGNYVIIDHGNGLTTRYGHCSSLLVAVGMKVTKGQVIAKVGSTGASTGNHCHFEVRVNGVSKNPTNYLEQ